MPTPVRRHVASLRSVDSTAVRAESGAFVAVAIAVVTVSALVWGTSQFALTAALAIAFQGLVLVTPEGRPARAMFAAVPLVATSVFAACLVSNSAIGRLLLCTAIAAVGGLATAWGRRAGSVGMLCAVVAAIFSGQPIPGQTAFETAGVYFLCSCIPLLLLLVPSLRQGRGGSPAPAPSLRNLLTMPSAQRRHAARYAVGIALATMLAELDPTSRAFWIPMTVAWVLRPDRGLTNRIVLHRVAGTFAGVIVMAIVTELLGVSGVALALISAAMGGIFVGYLFAHYAIATMGVTGLVVGMIGLSGGSMSTTLVERMIDTTLGAALVVALILIWRDRPGEPELPAR